jgi:adenylyltransferase/sulfurtransferase
MNQRYHPANSYARHLGLPGFQPQHQQLISQAEVLVVGAGGLGAPLIAYLAGAGVGGLRIIDDDVVESTNLARQILFTSTDLGKSKAQLAGQRARQLNPQVNVSVLTGRFGGPQTAAALTGATVVVDCCDTFSTRYLLQAQALTADIPCVWGSVGQFDGRCSVVFPGVDPCIECLFGPQGDIRAWPTSAEAGVVSPVCGIVGSICASETLKVITGLGTTLAGRLAMVDSFNAEFSSIEVRRDPACGTCADVNGR